MLQTETLIIEHPDNPGQPMIINKSDFDPAVHKLYEPPPETPPEGDHKSQDEGAPAGADRPKSKK
jgi:hypothetical protein